LKIVIMQQQNALVVLLLLLAAAARPALGEPQPPSDAARLQLIS
jgi:hypothetical protein